MKLNKILAIATGFLVVLGGGGYWYVFVAGAPQFDAPVAEANTGLTFQVETFSSKAMGEERRYGLVLPPGYSQNTSQYYPVIVLLHGGHGSERDFEDKAALTSILHDLYEARKLPPSIVVTPDGNDKRGTSPLWDSDYYDGPNGKVATLIGTELVETVKSRYRVLQDPQFWAMGGSSSGGWGAFNIGLRRWQQFHVLFSHTGYFVDADGGPANSPKLFVSQLPAQARSQLKAYLDAGEGDHKYLKETKQFGEALTRLGIQNEFRMFPGGHGLFGQDTGWNYWHKHLYDSLGYVGKQFEIALAARSRNPATAQNQGANSAPTSSKGESAGQKSR
jgi:enterochelin esterase-like enzyme